MEICIGLRLGPVYHFWALSLNPIPSVLESVSA